MLRRRSTKSKSDLHHRKSTSSVRSVPLEHISVAVAQRDAKLAALQAFSRGQGRRAADMALFPLQPTSPYNKENTSPVQISRHRSMSSLNSEQNRQILDRKQSVRFVGPNQGLRASASKISARTVASPKNSATQHRPIQKSRSIQDVDLLGRMNCDIQGFKLSDRTSSRGKAKAAFHYDDIHPLAPDTQQYTPEDDIASQPSSYRRVRKSKSTVSSKALPEVTRQVAPPSAWPRLSFLHRKNSEPSLSTRSLRARKSISFVKHRRDHASSAVASQDTTRHSPVDLTTSPLPESSTRSRLLAKPSNLLPSKNTKTEGQAGQSLRRGSSSGIPYLSMTTNSIPLSIHGSMRAKARKASSSIKTKFKNLFVNKSEDDTNLPAQQIVAQRTHLTVTANSHLASEAPGLGVLPKRGSLGPALFTKRSSLSRIMPQIPSLTAVPSNELLRSRKGSIESFKSMNRSLSEDKSRVTSWASTEANTVVAHKLLEPPEEHNRQRLSVITENELQAVSRPLAPDDSEPASWRPVVDSQRVYSALMKRMNDTRQIADLVAQQRKSSDNSDPFRTLSPPTSDDSSEGRDSPAISHGRSCIGDPGPSHSAFDEEETSHRILPNSESGHLGALRPPVTLNPKGADLPPVVPRADRSSAFFGSPTSHLFRTRSPWRRSIQEAIERKKASSLEPLADGTDSADAMSTTETDDKKVDTASIYSQESQIHKPELHQEFPVAGDGRSTCGDDHGGVFSDVSSPHRTGQRSSSAASSIEWKAQLSHDVAKEGRLCLAPTRVTGEASEVEYVVPTMPRAFGHGHGHVREEAQIENYDEDEGSASPAVRLPRKGGRPLGVIEPNVAKLSPQQRSVMQRTPPQESRPITHEQSFGRVRAEDSGSPHGSGSPTVRLLRKSIARQEQTSVSATSTPYFSRAFERQFGTVPHRLSCDPAEKENQSPHGEGHAAGTQIGKSSTMVDVFVGSRRRKGTSGDGVAFV